MNLIYTARPALDAGAAHGTRSSLSNAAVSAYITNQKAVVQASLDAEMVNLQTACGAAAHDAIESPGASLAAAGIGAIVNRITDLEGKIQFYAQALLGLP